MDVSAAVSVLGAGLESGQGWSLSPKRETSSIIS